MKKIPLFSLMILIFNGCISEKYDIIIRNGTIIDGSGAIGYNSDLGILNGKMVRVLKKLISRAEH